MHSGDVSAGPRGVRYHPPQAAAERPSGEYWRRRMRLVSDYLLPKGKREAARLDLQHWILAEGLGDAVLAPVTQPNEVLDVACGSGIWLLEVARRFPQARITGIDLDLKPLEILRAKLGPAGKFPKRLRFERADARQPLPLAANTFAYVHSRHLSPFMPLATWLPYVRELARVAAPGGWIELLESELPDCAGRHYQAIKHALVRWAYDHLGLYNVGPELGRLLQEAGAVEITEQQWVLGTGQTAYLQAAIAENMRVGFTHAGQALVAEERMSAGTLSAHLAGMREEMAAGISWRVYAAYGQKAAQEERSLA